jgi:PKD repeat protein
VNEPAVLDATATASPVTFYNGNDGSIDAAVTGGNTAYSYAWSNGEIVQDIDYLTPGRYTLTVTDAKGCTDTVSALVNNATTFVQASVTGKDISCHGNTDGSVNLNVTGGIPPYSYIWSNGSTTEDISGLAAGAYTVTVSDGSTQATATATIGQPTQLSAVATSSDITCAGNTDGGVYLNVTGGTGTKTYQWSNGSNSEDLTGVGTGTYNVTISDANNCQIYKSGTVGYQGYSIVGGSVQYYCAEASINLQASNADSYEWSNGENAQTINVSPENNTRYTVTITDGSCTDTASALIIPRYVTAEAGEDMEVCYGKKINLTAGGGLEYQWSDDVTQSLAFKAYESNTYHVTVTDGYGCKGYDSIAVNVKTLPTAAFDYDITYGVIELYNYSEDATSYSWTFGDGKGDISFEPVHAYDETGTYTISLIAFDDYCGTSDTVSKTISIEALSVAKVDDNKVFEVYPNPCDGRFTVEFTSNAEDVEVKLFSSGSQNVLEKRYENVSNSTKLKVDITEYAVGPYYLKVKVGERVYVKPILYQ